jgi:hypothetical protein
MRSILRMVRTLVPSCPISLDGKQITTFEGGVENSRLSKDRYIFRIPIQTISSNAFMDSGLTEVHFYSASDYDPTVSPASSFTITGRAFLNCHELNHRGLTSESKQDQPGGLHGQSVVGSGFEL